MCIRLNEEHVSIVINQKDGFKSDYSFQKCEQQQYGSYTTEEMSGGMGRQFPIFGIACLKIVDKSCLLLIMLQVCRIQMIYISIMLSLDSDVCFVVM